MIAITQAAEALGSWRLEGCTLYVTLEPCPMCAGAPILQARIPLVVYGQADPKAGAVRSLYQLLADERLNHRAQTVSGVFAHECGIRLTRFFQQQRRPGGRNNSQQRSPVSGGDFHPATLAEQAANFTFVVVPARASTFLLFRFA